MSLLYHPSVYDDAHPVESYWEATAPPPPPAAPLSGDASCDVAVVGGGYTGLSTALHLARDYGIDVRVLEAGHLGWGASGRNGGFCCLAATKLSVKAMIARYGLDETKRFYAAQVEAIELVRALAGDEAIDYARQGDAIFDVAHRPEAFPELRDTAEAYSTLFGIETRVHSKEEFLAIGHGGTEQFGAMEARVGFGLHPLKFARGLATAALRRGAVLHPHSRVLDWTQDRGAHRLATAGGTLRAKRVVLASNGYTRDRINPAFDGRMIPALSNVLVTRPLSDAELAAQSWRTENPIVNSRNLLFYYRLLPDRRILFGARGDTVGTPQAASHMRAWLTRRLGELFPAWKDVEIDYFWRGLVCVTPKLSPSVGRLEDDPSVWYGFGYHGTGVNTAPWAGMTLARLIAGSNRDVGSIPAPLAGLPRRLPLAALRLWLLRAVYLYYRWNDK